jgi:isoleucyl-tRNA synthetase
MYARLHSLIEEVTTAYEGYNLKGATRPLRAFIEDLSTWWLRRSRTRIRGTDAYDRMDALKTLRETLLDFSALMAPAAPFMADRIYLDLEGMKASVHLERWPKFDPRLIDERLLADMATVRRAVSIGLERRATAKIPVRQALANAAIRVRSIADVERLHGKTDLLDLIRDELNVESVTLEAADVQDLDVVLDTNITPELKAKGIARELVRHIMALRKESGLKPQDEIELTVAIADDDLRTLIKQAANGIASQVKATEMKVQEKSLRDEAKAIKLDGKEAYLRIGA